MVGVLVAVSGKVGDGVGADVFTAVGSRVAVGSGRVVGCGGALQLDIARIKSNSNTGRTDCILHINTFL